MLLVMQRLPLGAGAVLASPSMECCCKGVGCWWVWNREVEGARWPSDTPTIRVSNRHHFRSGVNSHVPLPLVVH